MTSVSIMEPLDETMLEYPVDADIPMYSGNSVSGFWLSQEAAMDDDSNTVTLDSNSNHSETIEVDMEPHDHDEEMTEYDMVDGEFAHTEQDIPDVEVVESSPTLPATVVAEDVVVVVAQPAATELGPQPSLSSDAFPQTAASDYAPETYEHPHAMQPSNPVEPPEQATSFSPEYFTPHAEISPVAAADSAHTGGDAQDANAASAVANAKVSEEVSLPAETRAADSDPADAPAPVLAEESKDNTGHTAAVPATEGEPPNEGVEAVEHAEPELRHEDEGHDEEHYAEPDENPLEISDGVYIDPPPAVLLNIVLGAEHTECSLFNQPMHDSYPQGSNVDQSAASSEELPLVLHDQPTLYYEPLSKVFSVLREEGFIQNTPELGEGELVLDAYDLQLAISEDNIHAPEVTIHELNVLHDASGLQGPLRMRLYALTPRFISRYNALRDQLLHLNVDSHEPASDEHIHEGQPEFEQHELHEDNTQHLTQETEHPGLEGDEYEPQTLEAGTDMPASEDLDEPRSNNSDLAADDERENDTDGHIAAEPLSEHVAGLDASPSGEVDPAEQAVTSADGEAVLIEGEGDDHLPEPIQDVANVDLAGTENQEAQWDEHLEDNHPASPDGHEYEQERDAERYDQVNVEEQVGEEHTALVDQSHAEGSIEQHDGELPTISEHVEDTADADADADGEYDDDPSYYAADDGQFQNFEDARSEDELYETLPSSGTAVATAPAPEPLQASTSNSTEQSGFTTTTDEDFGQELLEFEDEPEEAHVQTQHTPSQNGSRQGAAVSPSTSSKRTYDQLDLEEDADEEPPSSPDSKRLRAA